jgi:predicted CoA-binding protein
MLIRRTSRELAEEFLAQKTLAVIGLSRTKNDFSRKLFDRLQQGGREIFAVNCNGGESDGVSYYQKIADVPKFVDGALLMVPESALGATITECAVAGVPRLWIYGVGHPRILDREWRALCNKLNISIINGLCPMMFLRDTAWPHHLHGWIATRNRAYRSPI